MSWRTAVSATVASLFLCGVSSDLARAQARIAPGHEEYIQDIVLGGPVPVDLGDGLLAEGLAIESAALRVRIAGAASGWLHVLPLSTPGPALRRTRSFTLRWEGHTPPPEAVRRLAADIDERDYGGIWEKLSVPPEKTPLGTGAGSHAPLSAPLAQLLWLLLLQLALAMALMRLAKRPEAPGADSEGGRHAGTFLAPALVALAAGVVWAASVPVLLPASATPSTDLSLDVFESDAPRGPVQAGVALVWLLSGFTGLAPHGLALPLSLLLGAAAVLLTGMGSARLFGPVAGIGSAALLCGWPALVIASRTPGPAASATFLLAACMALAGALRHMPEKGERGLLAGLLALCLGLLAISVWAGLPLAALGLVPAVLGGIALQATFTRLELRLEGSLGGAGAVVALCALCVAVGAWSAASHEDARRGARYETLRLEVVPSLIALRAGGESFALVGPESGPLTAFGAEALAADLRRARGPAGELARDPKVPQVESAPRCLRLIASGEVEARRDAAALPVFGRFGEGGGELLLLRAPAGECRGRDAIEWVRR